MLYGGIWLHTKQVPLTVQDLSENLRKHTRTTDNYQVSKWGNSGGNTFDLRMSISGGVYILM